MRSRDHWRQAAACPRRPRTPPEPSRDAGAGGATCFAPVLLRSYLNLRYGRRGRGRLNGTHQIGKHSIEELIDLLWRTPHVGRGIQLLGRSPYAELLELAGAGQAVEQIVSALETLRANDFVQLLSVCAGLHAAHQQPLRGEIPPLLGGVLPDPVLRYLEAR